MKPRSGPAPPGTWPTETLSFPCRDHPDANTLSSLRRWRHGIATRVAEASSATHIFGSLVLLFYTLSQTRPLEFDHRAPGRRHLARNNYRAALGQMERRVLLAIDVLARRAIDRKDHLVA